MVTGNGSTTLRRYRVRNERGRWVGDFVISDDGYFSTVSDYGNYAFWWGHAGDCFREFLTQLDPYYLCSKLGRGRDFYDGEASLRNVKRRICELRRERSLSRDEARDEWDLLRDKNDLYSREDFAMWWQDTKIDDASELSVWTYAPDLRGFAENVYPAFAKMLREELAAEHAQSSGAISSATP